MDRPTQIPEEVWRLLPAFPFEYPKFPCAILPLPRFILDQICPGVQPPPPPPPGLATVRVTVLASNTGKTITGANVSLDGQQVGTNQSGVVDFINVTLGIRGLSCSAAGYQPHSQPIDVREGTNLFQVEMKALAPTTISISLLPINYPVESSYYDAALFGGPVMTDVRIGDQAYLTGPNTTTLTITIYNEGGLVIFSSQTEVTLEDKQLYFFDCLTSQLILQPISWQLFSLQIPAQIPYNGEFLPSASLRIPKDGKLYRFKCQFEASGQGWDLGIIQFLGRSFVPPEYMQWVKASRYLPLDAPDDIYNIQGCYGEVGGVWQQVPCRLIGRYQTPVPVGTYPVSGEVFRAPIAIVEGDITTAEPREFFNLGVVAQIEVI